MLVNAQSPAKSPLISTPTECHYRGTLINGKEFDSSYKRGSPATFAPNQVRRTCPLWSAEHVSTWVCYAAQILAIGRPVTRPCCLQVIKGWTEAMQLMKEGDKWELYIPSVPYYTP